jgi:hypothetical protein
MEAPQAEWAELYLAFTSVLQHTSRMADGQDGQDVPRKAAPLQDSEGITGYCQTTTAEIPAKGQWRPP